MSEYTDFPQENIDKALALAQRSAQGLAQGVDLRSTDMLTPEMALRAGPANFSAGCISLVSAGDQVCLRVPLIGDLCVPLDLPDGTGVSACIDVCTHWGVPTGVCLKLSVAGNKIFSQCFGWC